MLAIGGFLFIQQETLMSSLMPAFALSWALVLVYAVPVAVAIYWLDLFEREPKLMLAAAVIWGGVIATSLAAYANEAWLSVLGKIGSPDFVAAWGTAIVGPGVEETLKLMGVVVLFLIASAEFDGVLDGFVYGAMVGLGFTVVEDVSYFIRHVVDTANTTVDQAGPVIDTFLIRVVGGGPVRPRALYWSDRHGLRLPGHETVGRNAPADCRRGALHGRRRNRSRGLEFTLDGVGPRQRPERAPVDRIRRHQGPAIPDPPGHSRCPGHAERRR